MDIEQKLVPNTNSARWGTLAVFFADGAAFGAWAAAIPVIKANVNLTHEQLSLVLLCLILGSLVTMPLTGTGIARYGSRFTTVVGIILYLCALTVVALPSEIWVLALCAAAFGGGKGALDVSINAHAVEVQRHFQKPILATFQALWSVGGLVGSLLCGLLLSQSMPVQAVLPTIVFMLALVGFFGWRVMLPASVTLAPEPGAVAVATAEQPKRRPFRIPGPFLAKVCLLCFLSLFGEGVMADWSSVFLHEERGLTPATAAMGFAAYSVAMALARFCGDAIHARLGSIATLRYSGISAAFGMLLAIAVDNSIASIIGFLFVGFGLANTVPILFAAAARDPEMGAGPGTATAAMAGYIGFLAGPPGIGLLASVFGLPAAMATVALFAAGFSAFAHFAVDPTPKPTPATTLPLPPLSLQEK